MFVTYTPDGDPVQEWDLDIDDMAEEDAEAIERQFRKVFDTNSAATFDAFRLQLYQGGSTARRVLLWHLIRQKHPTLRYEDTPKIRRSQFKVEFSRGEYKVFLERAMEQPPSSERDAAIEMIEREMATARDSLNDDAGKA